MKSDSMIHQKPSDKKLAKPWKVLIGIAVLVLALFIAGSYQTTDLDSRAIVIGMGIDFKDGEFAITAEVISPGESSGGSSNDGGGATKLVVGHGETVAMAIHDIYKLSGRTPSLGQTSVLVLGESMYVHDLRDVLSVFQFSDSFKDGVIVVGCKGEAKELFEATLPLDSMATFALQNILINSGKNTGTPSNNLSKFLERQLHGGRASYLCRIEFAPESAAKGGGEESGGGGGSEEQKQGMFDCSQMDVFKLGRFVSTVKHDETKGFILLGEKKGHLVFSVDDARNHLGVYGKATAEIVSKNVKSKFSLREGVPVAEFEIDVKVRNYYIDSTGEVMGLLPEFHSEMPENVLAEIEKQMKALVEKSLSGSIAVDCDYLELHEKFYRSLGKEWEKYFDFNPDYLQKIKFEVKIKVKEQ